MTLDCVHLFLLRCLDKLHFLFLIAEFNRYCRFSRMSECLTAVLEQWCSLSSSSTEASKSVGLDRLRKLADTVEAPDDEARASIPRALLARLEQGEQDSLELSSADVLDVFAFLCQQFWSPLLDFTTSLLTSSD